MRKSHLRKLLCLIILSLFGTIFTLFIMSRNLPTNDVDWVEEIDESIPDEENSLACKQPKLEVFSPEIMKFVHRVSPLGCSQAGKDWVKCEGFECKVQEEINDMYGNVECVFTDIIRINDQEYVNGDSTYSDSYYKLQKSDVVQVSCKSQKNYQWSATLTGTRLDPNIWRGSSWRKLPVTATQLNVLIFGFDSLSRNSFIRKLPKSYTYLTKVLGAHVLKGYNILGDGTPAALIPILTGTTESELPDTRRGFPKSKFVNCYPFIWNDFKEAGYVTGFYEDIPKLGTFTYRLNGFNETPTDHYMRTYYVASEHEKHKWPNFCTGEIARHQVMMNQVKNFFNVYRKKPKFLFAFHGELSHDDYNLVEVADDDLYNLLKHLKVSGILDNTLLIVMADHGHRFAEIRNTAQGKQEEKLPFFSFTFPFKFKSKFGKAYENFRSNINKLTTPFDVYATLKHMLNLDNVEEGDIRYRSISLFNKIPNDRNCTHADIAPHWCACLDWEEIDSSSPLGKRIAKAFISKLNSYTESHRSICEILNALHIHWIVKSTSNKNLHESNENLTTKKKITREIYQIKIVLVPGHSIFEATLTYMRDEDKFHINMSDISRINMYGRQARCVENNLPHLRKYCYCKT